MTGLKSGVNACCPVCGTWFYRKAGRGRRQKYDKELCKKISMNKAAARRRAKAREAALL